MFLSENTVPNINFASSSALRVFREGTMPLVYVASEEEREDLLVEEFEGCHFFL